MRAVSRFLSSVALAAVAASAVACSNNNSSPMAPMPARGRVDSTTLITTITTAQMTADSNFAIIGPIGGAPLCNVNLYEVDYETIGVKGERSNASEGLFVPQTGCTGPFPLLGYAHGTNIVKAQLISDPSTSNAAETAPDQLPIVVAEVYASQGYVVAATDYLGLGRSTYPYHPYLQVESEASAVIDGMRAARGAAKNLNFALSGDVMLAGYSQGGQVTAATQRAIERDEPREFNLRGVAPSSGPYALTQTFIDSLMNGSQDESLLAAYILTGYQKTYGNLYTSGPTDVFQMPYATGIDSLLPVATFAQVPGLATALPPTTAQLLQPAFITSYETSPTFPARIDTALNDLLVFWTPKAPVFLCGGKNDPEVEFTNATAAQAYFTGKGATSTLEDVDPLLPAGLPASLYHVTVADFCLPLARKNFLDGLRSSATLKKAGAAARS